MRAVIAIFIIAFLEESRCRSVLLDVVPLQCQCPDSIQSVCGEDGNTYNNRCAANCRNVAVISEGSCEARGKRDFCEDKCYSRLAAVCAKSGQTYQNICVLECRGDHFAHFGSCKKY